MATIDLMDRFGNLGSGGIKNNGALDAEATFFPALRTMRTDFIQVKAGDNIVYKNMNGMSSSWNILSFYTGEAQGYYTSGIAGQTTPQSGVWTAQQDGYVRLFGSFPAGDKISVTMTDLAPDVEDYLAQYDAMNYRFLPNSIPKIVAHIQEYLSNHPIADSTTLQAVIDAAFQSYMEEIQQTSDTYIAEAVPPAAAAAVDAAASPALQEITAKTAEAAESARQAGLSQQSAEMSEENTLTYRNQAQQIKDSITAEVAASVQAAQEQATLAQESAQAADESADTAEQYVAQARAQAEAAADQAQTASGYASDAQGYMQDASGYAQNAAQSAATFTTDPTLTISGKAADAKVTGDELSALKSALNDTDDNLFELNEFCRKENIISFSYNKTIPANGMQYGNFIITCDVPSGATYNIIINDLNNALGDGLITLYAHYNDDTSKSLGTKQKNTTYSLEAEKNIIAFSIYKSTTIGGVINTSVLCKIKTEDSLEQRIENAETEVDTLQDNWQLLTEYTIGLNYTNPSKVYGGSINNETGVITPSSDPYYAVSDKIGCVSGETVYLYYKADDGVYIAKTNVSKVAFYREDGTFISIGYNEDSYIVPDNASYLVQQGPYTRMIGGTEGVFKTQLPEASMWYNYEDPELHLVTDTTLLLDGVPADAKTVGRMLNGATDNYYVNYGDIVVEGGTTYVHRYIILENLTVGHDYEVKIDKITGAVYDNAFQVLYQDDNHQTVDTLIIRERENISVSVRPTAETPIVVLGLYPKAGGSGSVTATYYNVRIIENDTDDKLYLDKKIHLYDETQIPSYYYDNAYIQNKADYIKQKYAEAINEGSGDAFIFITDTHWPDNQKQSIKLIKYLHDKTFVPRVFHGGDLERYNVDEEYVNDLKTAYSGDIHYIAGNHELYYNSSSGGLAFVQLDAGKNMQIGNPQRHYYYVDNDQNRIRYIILNVFDAPPAGQDGAIDKFEQEQQEWFSNVALNAPNGYGIIIFVHYLVGIQGYYDPDYIELNNIVDTAKDNKDIICIFTGHAHYDALVNTKEGVPVIITTCDKNAPWIKNGVNMEPWMEQRVSGTITEQAFDAVILNHKNEYVRCIRVGGPAQDCYIGSTTDDFYSQEIEERIVHYKAIHLEQGTQLTPMIVADTWKSSNTNVCTVSNGSVTPVGNGVAYVSTISADKVLEAWIIVVSQ